jgi:hypothetical protein
MDVALFGLNHPHSLLHLDSFHAIDEIDNPDASLHVMGQFRGLFREPTTNDVTKAKSAVADPRQICFTDNVDNSFMPWEIASAVRNLVKCS